MPRRLPPAALTLSLRELSVEPDVQLSPSSSRNCEPPTPRDGAFITGLYESWAGKKPPPIAYESGKISGELWFSHAARAYVDALVKDCPAYERYCLAQFIQNCILYETDIFEFVEENCPTNSSLRRFSNYWVAWNHRLTGLTTKKYIGLEAAWLWVGVKDTSEDPRPYDLDHWFLACGDNLAPECDHVPSIRRRNALEAERAINMKPTPAVFGKSMERRAQKQSNCHKLSL